jgi:hypothetical protein
MTSSPVCVFLELVTTPRGLSVQSALATDGHYSHFQRLWTPHIPVSWCSEVQKPFLNFHLPSFNPKNKRFRLDFIYCSRNLNNLGLRPARTVFSNLVSITPLLHGHKKSWETSTNISLLKWRSCLPCKI